MRHKSSIEHVVNRGLMLICIVIYEAKFTLSDLLALSYREIQVLVVILLFTHSSFYAIYGIFTD